MNLKSFQNFILRKKLLFFAFLVLFIAYFFLYQIYIPRINAFGCFDDCNNFMRGYFFLHGNPLFSHVFSGHQPLGSYLSALIQFVTSPESIYELILRHRQFIIVFGLISNFLLILRFGPKMILFTLIFEFSKFYIFGDRFLGESMIVYPAVYLCGLVLQRIWQGKIYWYEYSIAALLCWFIVFLRITFVPMTALLFLFIFFDRPLAKLSKAKVIAILIFIILSLITIFLHDVPEYFFNVVVFNYQVNLPAETKIDMFGPKVLHWFFYPLYIFFYGPLNLFRTLLIGINVVFLAAFIQLLISKKYLTSLFIFLLLGAANIRTVLPGDLFLGSFHMVPWFGLFIFIVVMLLFREAKNKKIMYSGVLILIVSLVLFLSSPKYFAKEGVDSHSEFINNYGYVLQQGEVIKLLSDENDTLFLDGSDDLIYWQSGLFSQYKYSWFTSSMSRFDKFNIARIEMFKKTPPDFYREYGRCPKNESNPPTYFLPDFVKDDYVNLHEDGRPSCVYVHLDKLEEINDEKRAKAAEWLYTIPDEDY